MPAGPIERTDLLMGEKRFVAKLAAICLTLGLVIVPAAGAYTVPGAPGTPGGKPTAPTGGSSISKSATKAAAQTIAGYTGLELALRTPSVNFFFPKAGKVSCTLKSGSQLIGSGTASKDKKGSKQFSVNLTNSGRTFLYNRNGTALSVSVKCTFDPLRGKPATSSSTVVLDS